MRKNDPGEKFPWKKLSNHNLGKWYKKQRKNIKVPLKNVEISFFKNLKKIGYRYFSIHKRTYKDKRIIKIFQQHYLPENVTGKIDQKTFDISGLLT